MNIDGVYNDKRHGKDCTEYPPPCGNCWTITKKNFGELYNLEIERCLGNCSISSGATLHNVVACDRWLIPKREYVYAGDGFPLVLSDQCHRYPPRKSPKQAEGEDDDISQEEDLSKYMRAYMHHDAHLPIDDELSN